MATRTASFVYGAVTIGSTSEYLLDSAIRLSRSYGRLTASCQVVLRADDTTAMESRRNTLETEFRKILQTLTITYSGSTRTFSHSANTGFNQRPTITRIPSPSENALLCLYEVSVEVELPADLSADNGLSDLVVEVTSGPTEYTQLSFSGSYTALGSNSAKDQYDAQIAALTSTLQTEAGAALTWETVAITGARDKENKHYGFTSVYREHNTTAVFKLTYAGVEIGGTDYLLDSPIWVERNYTTLTASCDVRLKAANTTDMETKRLALETAFRKINQTLVVRLNSTDRTFQTSDGTGFNARAAIFRKMNEKETSLIALYRVSVVVELPADASGDSGLYDLQVSAMVGQTDLKTLRFAGEYTALSTNSAIQQYAASIAALVTSLQTEFGPTTRWEPVNIEYSRDKTSKRVRFTHEYIETIDREEVTGLDRAYIRQAQTNIRVAKLAAEPLPSPGIIRDEILTLNFRCLIQNTSAVQTDETELRRIWISDIKPNIVSRLTAYAVANGTSFRSLSILRMEPSFNTDIPSIEATVEVLSLGDSLLSGMISETLVSTPPWLNLAEFSGNPFAKVTIPISASAFFTRTVRVMGRGSDRSVIGLANGLFGQLPASVSVGPGITPINTTKYQLPDPSLLTTWRAVLSDKSVGVLESSVDGPMFMGFDTEQEHYAVTLRQEVEYFNKGSRSSNGGGDVVASGAENRFSSVGK